MTIDDSLRALLREEMRPVEIKLSLMASLIQQLFREIVRRLRFSGQTACALGAHYNPLKM